VVAEVAGGGYVRVRPVPGAGERIRDRHTSAHGIRTAPHRTRLLLHPHRPDRPVPADARPGRVLSDRLGRQRAADRTAGAEPLRGALRSVAPVRPFVHTAVQTGPETAGADLPAQFRGTVHPADDRGREGVRVAVAPDGAQLRLVLPLHHDRCPGPGHLPTGVPAQPGPGRGVPGRGAVAVGRDVLHRGGPGRARGPGPTRRLPPAALHRRRRVPDRHRHHPARVARRVRGARVPSRRHPIPAARRYGRAYPPVRGRGARVRPPARGSRQGHRHRDDLYVRRPDGRDVVARPAARHPGHRGPRRADSQRGSGHCGPHGVRADHRAHDGEGPGLGGGPVTGLRGTDR
jgi:hypothetical protein